MQTTLFGACVQIISNENENISLLHVSFPSAPNAIELDHYMPELLRFISILRFNIFDRKIRGSAKFAKELAKMVTWIICIV